MHFVVIIIKIVCAIMLPKDPDGLFHAVGKHILSEEPATDSELILLVKKAQVALPQQCIQRKVILAFLCNTMSFKYASKMLNIGKASFNTSRRHY